MKEIEFIPAIFEQIDYESMETEICPCSPGFPQELDDVYGMNSLKINVPEKVFFRPSDEEFVPFLPLCMAYSTSHLRTLKYHNLSEKMIHIKSENENSVYIGNHFNKRLMYKSFHDFTRLFGAEWERLRQEEIDEAQKLSDEELDKQVENIDKDRNSIVHLFTYENLNINALDFVYIPIRTGKYEIWVTHYGMESNHAIVDIVVEGDKEVINNFSANTGTSKVINHSLEETPTEIVEEELPEI